jgi:predicted acyltransferase
VRSVRLFLLGLFLNNGPSWHHWRIPGVLQALAVGYFVVAFADLAIKPSTSNISTNSPIKMTLIPHLAMVVTPLIAVNVAITFALPVPGCPTGYIGPGGNATESDGAIHTADSLANCTGGAHLLVDLTVFGRDHIFQTPTCQQAFGTGPYDPEGLLNWLMVITTAHLGYCSALLAIGTDPGGVSKTFYRHRKRVVGAGAALIAAGLLIERLAGVPINKNLWSLPFVLVCSGLASVVQALIAVVVVASEAECFSDPSASTSRQLAWAYARFPWAFVGANPVAIYAMVRGLTLNLLVFSLKASNSRFTSTRFAKATRHSHRGHWTEATSRCPNSSWCYSTLWVSPGMLSLTTRSRALAGEPSMNGLVSLTLAALAVVTSYIKVGLRSGVAAPTWRVHQALRCDGRLEAPADSMGREWRCRCPTWPRRVCNAPTDRCGACKANNLIATFLD